MSLLRSVSSALLIATASLCLPRQSAAQCYTFSGVATVGTAVSLGLKITNLPTPIVTNIAGQITYVYNFSGSNANTVTMAIGNAVYSLNTFDVFSIETIDSTNGPLSSFVLAFQSVVLPNIFRGSVELFGGAGNFFLNGLPPTLPAASAWPTAIFTVTSPVAFNESVILNSISSACAGSTGILAQVSSVSDGTAWGLTSGGQIYRWNAQSLSWQYVPGILSQIATGGSPYVWGLTQNGLIYHFIPSTQTWNPVPGFLSQLSVGADGDVWGIASTQAIFHFNAALQIWELIPGFLNNIAVGSSSAVWGLTTTGYIYRFDPATAHFELIPGILKQISVGSDGDAWGISPGNFVYHFDSNLQQWIQAPGILAQISVASANSIWGVTSGGNVYVFNTKSQTWNPVAGIMKQVTASANGMAWGIDAANNVYQLAAP